MSPAATACIPAIDCLDQPEQLRKILAPAAAALAQGELVAFPTETVYGLGASIQHPSAVESIFKVKGRPNDNPLIVHVADVASIEPLVSDFHPTARLLANAFMPGPLTLILPRSEIVPDCVTAGLDTVGVRVPEPLIARTLLKLAGVPVAAPSANLSGKPSPTTANHVYHDLAGHIPYIVDGGPCRVGLESTVLYLCDDQPRILRPGAITAAEILEVLDEYRIEYTAKNWRSVLRESDRFLPNLNEETVPTAPGMKYRHYAPEAKVEIIPEAEINRQKQALTERLILWLRACDPDDACALYGGIELIEVLDQFAERDLCQHLPVHEDRTDFTKPCVYTYDYGETRNSRAAAHHLFAALRSLDAKQPSIILAPALPFTDVGAAYMNRLFKAAGKEII